MPSIDDTTPRRDRTPRMEATISNLGLSHATVTRDEYSGVVSVSIGSVDQRVTLADDPAVLIVLLEDSVAQIQAISTR
jgi:hypothetical protein